MSILEDIVEIIAGLIIIGIVVYFGISIFIEFSKAAFGLSILTGIGFVVSIIFAAYKEVLTLESMVAIFVGTIISYAAGTLIPIFIDNVFAGQFIAAAIYLFLIFYLYLKAQEVKGV